MAKVAINGMGRIGRAALKIILDQTNLEVVAVNDLMDPDNLVYLLKFDTVYGRYHRNVAMQGGNLVVEKARAHMKERLTVWGAPPQDFVIMKRIKEEMDPYGLFCPGRFVGGI